MKKNHKLTLGRETLRRLATAELARAAAGGEDDGASSGTIQAEVSRYPVCPVVTRYTCPIVP